MPRVRRNVNRLPEGDQTVWWLEKAIGVMKAKPIADPLGWRFLAAIHGYSQEKDPLRAEADVLPAAAVQERYWKQCQHGTWFFLPWHRMYLHMFERIVLKEIQSMGGPGDWALPYWNYSASEEHALLPKAFQRALKPDGTTNHLHTSCRGSNVNCNKPFTSPKDTKLDCLEQPEFAGAREGGGHGFGGIETRFEHEGFFRGALENGPHGSMHDAVGGGSGWMLHAHTAPLDPIFWLHHCNVDRLWEVWLRRQPFHSNPTSGAWLDAVEFDFIDWNRSPISLTSRDVLDTRAQPLDYEFDDTSDPLPAPVILLQSLPPRRVPTVPRMAELIGATLAPFWLRGASVEHSIRIVKPTGPAAESFGIFDPLGVIPAPDRFPRVFVRVENIRSDVSSVPYDVFLNLPAGSDPDNHEDRRAGRLSMFGLVEASKPGKGHVGHGVAYALDVTNIVRLLAREPGWKAEELRVTLVPAKRPEPRPATAEVGRISIYLE